MSDVWIAHARRTATVPRNGAFRSIEAYELGAAVITSLAREAELPAGLRMEVIFGNALYGGGNPARMAALAAGLPLSIPALSVDTQCCSGLDAIALGASRIRTGEADIVIAGGMESYSRSPLRYRRPLSTAENPLYYVRPPFSPWPDRDPDLLESAASLATERCISRMQQEIFAIESHTKAMAAVTSECEMVGVSSIHKDAFSRQLSTATCRRLPVLTGNPECGLTAATIAVEADAAAALILVGDKARPAYDRSRGSIRYLGARSCGSDPGCPSLAPVRAAQALLGTYQDHTNSLAVVEIMEAFAVQAQVFITDLGLEPAIVNRSGGALSRGHPTGASGAILAVRLFHELQQEARGARGLAAIAAAGGLGSAILFERD